MKAPPALADPNFRWFWAGLLSFTHAIAMYRFLLPWLAFEITGSTLAIAGVALASSVPGLIALPYASVIADRLDRTRILRLTQASSAVIVLFLAGILLAGVFEVGHLVVMAALMSVVHSFDQPARMSIVPALIRGSALVSAFALSGAAWNLAQIAGPALSGALIAATQSIGTGPGPILLLVASGYTFTAFAMTRVHVEPSRGMGPSRAWASEFAEGLRFALGRSETRAIILIVLTTGTFGTSYAYLMPAFAKDVYGVDARGLGVLMSSVGVGALIGTTLLGRYGGEYRRGVSFLAATFALGVILLAFTLSRSFLLSIPLLFGVGALAATYLTLGQSLLAMLTPDAIRGRVLGLFALTFAVQGLGAAISGAVAAVIGPPLAVALAASIVIAVVALVAVTTPGLRSID